LEKRVKDEGLTGRIFFLGSVAERDLVDVYNSGDIFILVSDRGYGRGEGVPLTPLEAAACGKPIIVGDEDGSREAVEDGENGFIVSPRELENIAKAITTIVDDPVLRERMGQYARQRVERDFSYTVFQHRTSAVIKNLY
jgi:phosphatidylinositol alpha-1,6-mannosyltransferase